MLSNAELKTIITANLGNVMLFPIQVWLNKLIDRGDHGADISRFRIKYNDIYITDLGDLITKLSSSNITVDVSSRASLFPSVSVTFDDITVDIDSELQNDSYFAIYYGTGIKKIAFDMANVYDADLILPFKIIRAVLT